MEVRVNRGEFLKKLKTVEKAISENKIKPIISCAYIETSAKGLEFYGTNLEITIITSMPCETKEAGKIVFQHQIVEEYLKELNDEFVSLRANDAILTIETADSATEFSLFPVDEFPKSFLVTDIGGKDTYFNINSSEFVDILEKTKFAAAQSSDDMRINCIKIDAANGSMKFVGTDTFRLVYLEKEIAANKDFSVSLPLNTVDIITKLFRSLPVAQTEITVASKNVKFEIDGTTVVSRIIDLPYPDYSAILGRLNYNKHLKIKSSEFLNILKRVIIFVRNNNDSKFGAVFNLNGNKLSILGSNEVAKINEESIVNYIGEEIKISLNTKFLIEFISNLDSDKEVVLEFINSNGSVKITENGNNSYIYIVMPLALRG